MLLGELLLQFKALTVRAGTPWRLPVERIDTLPDSLEGFTPHPATLYLHDTDLHESAAEVNQWNLTSPQDTALLLLTPEAPADLTLNVRAWLTYPAQHLPLSLGVQLARLVYEQRAAPALESDQRLGELLEEAFSERLPMNVVLDRSAQVGVDLSRATQVMLLRPPSEVTRVERAHSGGVVPGSAQPGREALYRELHRAAANLPARVTVSRVAGFVVLLFDSRAVSAEVVGERVAAHLDSAFPQVVVPLASGSAVAGAHELPRSYREAQAALDASADLPRVRRFVTYEDVRHLLIYREIRRNPALVDLIESTLRPLASLEGEHRRHMLETLVSYLEHGRSPARAAAALGVHPNTMKYRMKRIAEFIDLEQVSGQQDALYYLAAQLALQKSRP